MKKIFAAAVVAAGLFASLPASAEVHAIADTLYIDDSDLSVWQETNGEPGLQKVATDTVAADTRLA